MEMLIAFCLLLQTSLSSAEVHKRIVFENQREEIFDLENFLKKTVMTTEEVKDTCTKKIPYEEKVCKDETKYKKECKTVPSHQECKDVNRPICHTETTYEQECERAPGRQECRSVNEYVCHNETRYDNVCNTVPGREICRTVNEPRCRYETRYENQCTTVPGETECRVVVRYHQECHQVPGGRQCRTIPPDIRCRVINGENKCEKIPAHEECTDAPSRQECRQVPYEERECKQGPSRQECRQVPRQEQVCENHSRQECTTGPSTQECRQVPRTEQVCGYESRQECTTIPGELECRQVPKHEQVCKDNIKKECKTVPDQKVCKDIPYKENVCKNETRYKDEKYECMKKIEVPREKIVKTHKARVQVLFDTKSSDVKSEFTVTLDREGELVLKGAGKNVLAFSKKQIENSEHGEINSISALYKILLLNRSEFFKFAETGIKDFELHKKSMEFYVDGKIELKRALLKVRISKKDRLKFEKELNFTHMESQYDGERTKISIDLDKLNAPKFGGIFNREHNVQLELKLNYSDVGDVVIAGGKLSTSFNENVKVSE